MAKIFLTGASGYIGGDVLHLLAKSHPQYRVWALIRDASKGEAITKANNQVQIVNGGLDDTELIAEEARNADVVVHLAATGHLKSVETIHQALSNKPKGPKPPYYIQISGASALAVSELADKSRVFGSGSDVIYNDLTGIESIKSLIKQYPSRAVDNYMMSAAEQNSPVKTAVVVPPVIYGQGRGPVNQRSIQIPGLANAILKRQRGLQIGSVEKAIEGNKDSNIWGINRLYFTGVGELSFSEISRRVAAAVYNLYLIPSREVDEISGEEADRLLPHGSVSFGINACSGAQRAEKVLG